MGFELQLIKSTDADYLLHLVDIVLSKCVLYVVCVTECVWVRVCMLTDWIDVWTDKMMTGFLSSVGVRA